MNLYDRTVYSKTLKGTVKFYERYKSVQQIVKTRLRLRKSIQFCLQNKCSNIYAKLLVKTTANSRGIDCFLPLGSVGSSSFCDDNDDAPAVASADL